MKEGGNQFASPVFKKRFARRTTTNRPFTFARNFDAEAISAAAQNRIVEQVGDRGVVITSPVRLPNNNEGLSISDIVRQSPVPVLIAHTCPKDKPVDVSNHDEDDDELDTSLVRRSGRSREPSDSFLSRRQYPHGTPQHSKQHRLPDDSYIGSQNSSNIDAEVSFTDQSTQRGRKPAGALPGSSRRSKKASIQQSSNALDISTGSSKENQKASATQSASSGSRKGSRKADTQKNSKALNTSKGSSKENHEASSAQSASSASSKRSKTGNSQQRKTGNIQQSFSSHNTSTASSKKSSSSAQPASPGPSKRSKKANRKQNSFDLDTSAGSSKENHEASTAQDASLRSSKRSKEASAQQSSTAVDTSAGNSREKHRASTALGATASLVKSSSRKHPAGKPPIAQSSGRRRKEKEQPVREKTPSPAKTAASNNGRKEKLSVSEEALQESFSTAEDSDDLSDVRSSRRNKNQSRLNARSTSKDENQSRLNASSTSKGENQFRLNASSTSKGENQSRLNASSTSKGEDKSEAELRKASGLPSGSEKRRRVVTATVAISKSGQKRKSPDAVSAEYNNSSRIKIGRRGVKSSTPSREGNESVSTNSVNRRREIDSSPVSAVSSSPSGGRKRAAGCSGDEDLDTLGSAPQKRGRNNHSSGAITSSPRKQLQNKRQASHSQNTSNNSSGIASSASGARKGSDASSDDEVPEALAPSPQKKGRKNQLSGAMTSSPPKQSQNKTQATKNTSKIISSRKSALANSSRENSSALKNKETRSTSNANVNTSVPEKDISSQRKQKPSSPTKRFFKDQERSPQKLVVNEIVGVRASPRKGLPKTAHSFWKTSRRASSQLQPKAQPSNVSASTVYDDVTFGGEVSGTREATRGRKGPHTRHRHAQDGSDSTEDHMERKGGRKVVTELDVIINKLDETEADIMEKSNLSRACRSGVHKAFTFTKRQLQETVSQLTEIQEMSSRVNKLKYQCKAMSEEMKENHSQKCYLLQELRSLGNRGVDADLVRIDEWLQDFEALQEAV